MIVRFATTNRGKIKEAQEILGIKVLPVGLDIDEIQSLDPTQVATKKAKAYFEKIQKPLLVEDVSLIFKALGKLPGTYIDDFSSNFGNEGLVELLSSYKNREALAVTTLVFIEESGKSRVFQGEINGSIATKPKGAFGFGWDPIFIPKGEKKTFAEMKTSQKNKFSMRKKALVKFKRWLSANGYLK